MSSLTLAYPYGETEAWAGKGTCWGAYGDSCQSQTQARTLDSDLPFYGTCVHLHTLTRTSKILQAGKWQRDVFASKGRLLILSSLCLLTLH